MGEAPGACYWPPHPGSQSDRRNGDRQKIGREGRWNRAPLYRRLHSETVYLHGRWIGPHFIADFTVRLSTHMQRDPLCGPGETVYFFHTHQTYPLMLGTSQMDTKEGDLLM